MPQDSTLTTPKNETLQNHTEDNESNTNLTKSNESHTKELTVILNSAKEEPFQIRKEVIRLIEKFLQKNKDSMLWPDNVPKLPTPDTSGNSYPLYHDVKDSMHPFEFLKAHPLWSKMLKIFNPSLDRDYLYQYQLKKLDPDLYKGFVGRGATIKKHYGLKFSDIVPTKSKQIDYDLENTCPEELQKQRVLNDAFKNRQR